MNCRLRIPTVLLRTFASHGKKNNLYDNLEIDSKATQGEIKSAYFKLSMQYHPDKNSSEEAKVKFRDISEAYEVLGNYEKRRQYDRGIQVRGSAEIRRPEAYKPQDIRKEAFRARAAMHRHTSDSPPPGTAKMYDFDTWTKEHYGWAFYRSQKIKEKIKMHRQWEEESNDGRLSPSAELSTIYVAIFLLFCSLVFFTYSQTFDTPSVNYTTNSKSGGKKDI